MENRRLGGRVDWGGTDESRSLGSRGGYMFGRGLSLLDGGGVGASSPNAGPSVVVFFVLALAGGRQAGGAFVSPNAASPDVSFTPYLPLFVVARDVDDAAGPVTFLRAPDAVFRGCDIDSRFPNAIGPDTILDVVGDGGAAELAPNRAYNGVGAEGGGAAGAGLGAGSCLDFLRRNPAIAAEYSSSWSSLSYTTSSRPSSLSSSSESL